MSDINTTLRTHILSEYLPGESESNLKDDTLLRTSGILDSMATLGLVSFIEERFGIQIDAHETGIEHFDRIEDIVRLIQGKLVAGV
jgi:acyl carrier protein